MRSLRLLMGTEWVGDKGGSREPSEKAATVTQE